MPSDAVGVAMIMVSSPLASLLRRLLLGMLCFFGADDGVARGPEHCGHSPPPPATAGCGGAAAAAVAAADAAAAAAVAAESFACISPRSSRSSSIFALRAATSAAVGRGTQGGRLGDGVVVVERGAREVQRRGAALGACGEAARHYSVGREAPPVAGRDALVQTREPDGLLALVLRLESVGVSHARAGDGPAVGAGVLDRGGGKVDLAEGTCAVVVEAAVAELEPALLVALDDAASQLQEEALIRAVVLVGLHGAVFPPAFEDVRCGGGLSQWRRCTRRRCSVVGSCVCVCVCVFANEVQIL
eukprot:Rhum_TRINITY_DN15333_c1_g1::Rhum_TRINITY_DN15333_c1_g1_i1::g.152376::m.152376